MASAQVVLDSTALIPGPSGFVEPWKNPAWRFMAVLILPSLQQ